MPDAQINGLSHHWEDQGDGEPLVMLHGATSSSLVFRPHVQALSGAYRVITPDLRGMGRSAHVEALPPSAWIDDLIGLLDHLGIASAHVYGVSLGARIALRAAVDHPGRVRSLILEQPLIAIEEGANSALNTNIGGFDALPPEQQRAREAHHGADWRDVLRNFFAIRNKPELQAHLDLRELCKEVVQPTLIVRGDQIEPVHPLSHAFELRARMPNAALWIRPETPSNVLNAAPDEAYAAFRRLTARAGS